MTSEPLVLGAACCLVSAALGCGAEISTVNSASAGTAGRSTGPSGSGGAGGSSGGSGGSGLGGAPPITVANCDGLAAVGVWERLGPMGLRTGPTAFAVDPVNRGTVYLGTGDGCQGGQCDGVFKTTDCGATWQHVSDGTNAAAINGGDNWTFEIDPTNPDVLYTNSGYGALGLYKSTDRGVNWTEITPKGDGAPGFVSRTQMDPDDPRHLLVDWHSDCTGPSGPGCFAETKDGGQTWVEYYHSPPWSGQANVYLLNTLTWIVASDGLFRTTDGGKTWTKLNTSLAVGGHSAGRLYRAKQKAYYIGTTSGVIRSTWDENGANWTEIPNSGVWVFGMTGDGTSMFSGGQAGFMQSAESDGLTWTLMPNSAKHSDGCAGGVDPDPKHNLLYASCGIDGFYRVRVR
jgi:photosystem II stability/assembly factor-like uncharacterized protein